MSRISKKCELCLETFQCRRDKINTARFCSRICLYRYAGRQNALNVKNGWKNKTEEEKLEIKKSSFEKFFEKTDGCWEWQGNKKQKLAYGCFRFRGKILIASRVSYEIYTGPIPKKLIVMHTCDNPPCVNPNHLKVGTYLDNQKDKMRKGRGKVEKLNEEQVRDIKKELILHKEQKSRKGYYSMRQIGKRFNVSTSAIKYINDGRTWSWITIE